MLAPGALRSPLKVSALTWAERSLGRVTVKSPLTVSRWMRPLAAKPVRKVASPLAVVAVLEGTVMGGGFGLACVADVAIASDTANFRLPETSLGVVPAQIAPFLVERLGYSQAKRLAVTGGRLDAEQALRLGLVHSVVDTANLQAELNKVLADILACAPGALAATKALMAQARLREPQDLVQPAAAIFSRAAQGPEGMEGISAFMQKRKPQWAQP